MPDRENVLKGLEVCSYSTGKECIIDRCPYIGINNGNNLCVEHLISDALELLKAQEPRVMMLEEAKSAYVVEFRSGKMHEVGAALLNLIVDPLNTEYGKIYRVWTSRPTDEQRDAIPWN